MSQRRLLEIAALFGAADVLFGLMLIGSAAALATGPLAWFGYGWVALSTLAPCAWTRISPTPRTSTTPTTDPAGRPGLGNDTPTEDTPC